MKPTNFYEVTDKSNDLIWGGENAYEAVSFFRKYEGASIVVSVWDTQSEDDYRLINEKVNITNILLATILNEKERK